MFHTPTSWELLKGNIDILLQLARSLMFQSNLPKKFWGESILMATYVINHLPSFILDEKHLLNYFVLENHISILSRFLDVFVTLLMPTTQRQVRSTCIQMYFYWI